MTHEKGRTVTLHTYPDTAQAQIAQDKLQQNGIDSFLNDENTMGLDPVGGVELKVFEEDLAEAEAILKSAVDQ